MRPLVSPVLPACAGALQTYLFCKLDAMDEAEQAAKFKAEKESKKRGYQVMSESQKKRIRKRMPNESYGKVLECY